VEDEESYSKSKKKINYDEEECWTITKNKRLSVSTFKGTIYVNSRKYFEKDGK